LRKKKERKVEEKAYFAPNLPFIMAALLTIAVGAISYSFGIINKDLYFRMSVSMVVFYTLGLLVRSMLQKTAEEIERKKKEEEEKKREEELSRIREEKKTKSDKSSSSIDYSIGIDEDFEPLKVTQIIRSKMSE